MIVFDENSSSEIATELKNGHFGVVTGYHGHNRLSEATRTLAGHYLSGDIGRTLCPAEFAVDEGFLQGLPSDNAHYAEAAMTIAQNAPLRILSDELLVGAATMIEAMDHIMPLTPFRAISHTTLGFDQALKTGYRGIRQHIDSRLAEEDIEDDARDFLSAMRKCVDAATCWHGRYMDRLAELIESCDAHQRDFYIQLRAAAIDVPENPPVNFRQAIQSLWFMWAFQRLCGNWSGIGRFDKMLGGYLRRDLANGDITIDEARELVAHFWIKGCEWKGARHWGSGDAQFYQNIVLGGVDENGDSAVNEVTYMVLDVVKELHISDFPIAVRIGLDSPPKLLRRIAQVQRLGGGIIAVYNDKQIMDNLVSFGYPLAEARNFSNDGCWEILIPGKTAFGYQPFDTLLLLQESLGLSTTKVTEQGRKIECDERTLASKSGQKLADFADFEDFYSDFRARLEDAVDKLTNFKCFIDTPCPLLSMLVEGCVENGKSYLNGGPKYTVRSPHAGGLPDVANSLLVIKKLVYEDKQLTLSKFAQLLSSDWADNEPLRKRILRDFDFYGNDNAEADAMLNRVYNDFTDFVAARRLRHGVLRPAGISTFGREGTDFLSHRTASASGHRKGDVLAMNFSPTPGSDKRGPTAVIRSHCSVDFARLPCGTALELKISPTNVRGEAGLDALTALMKSFVALGGIFMQIDVVDSELLKDAQQHPEKYPNLSVRISGWSARFATLEKSWQDMVINRTEQAGNA